MSPSGSKHLYPAEEGRKDLAYRPPDIKGPSGLRHPTSLSDLQEAERGRNSGLWSFRDSTSEFVLQR